MVMSSMNTYTKIAAIAIFFVVYLSVRWYTTREGLQNSQRRGLGNIKIRVPARKPPPPSRRPGGSVKNPFNRR